MSVCSISQSGYSLTFVSLLLNILPKLRNAGQFNDASPGKRGGRQIVLHLLNMRPFPERRNRREDDPLIPNIRPRLPSTITSKNSQKQPVFCISPQWCFIRRLKVCLEIFWGAWLQIISSIQKLGVVRLGSGGAGGFIWLALRARRLEKRIQLLGFAVSADHLMGVHALLGVCWRRGFGHAGGRRESWKKSLRIMQIRQVLVKLDNIKNVVL